jgi:hypothetical protein
MVHAVACFELKRLTSLVGIAFLVSSSRFKIRMDAVDYFFSLDDKVRTKDHPFVGLDLVHRVTTTTAIQNFKGCHSETLLIVVVVGELSQRQTLVPFIQVVQHTSSEHILKNLIYPLCLTISLGMIC